MATTDFTPEQLAQFRVWAETKAAIEAASEHPPEQFRKRDRAADEKASRYFRQYVGEPIAP